MNEIISRGGALLRRGGARFAPLARRALAWGRRHAGRVAYYALIAAALGTIAWVAENRRAPEGESGADALILPAAELRIAGAEAAEAEMTAPEGGERLRGYSDAPEWNEALELWEAHAAVDYRLPGAQVYCLCAGVVQTVGESGTYGGFVEVLSGENLLRYASVEPDAALRPGEGIKAGERIGTADASMPSEANLGAHLHLELERAGVKQDFERWATASAEETD